MLGRAKNTPTRSFVSNLYISQHSLPENNLERGDTVQFTMQKPYIKYKITSSSRNWDICYKISITANMKNSKSRGKHEVDVR
jgi:hypothetical protein